LLFQTFDQGNSWQIVNTQFNPCGITFIEKNNSGRIYFNSIITDNGLFRSDNNAVTWKKEGSNFANCSPVINDKQGNLMAGNLNCLYNSTDDGNSWNLIKDFGGQITNIKLTSDGSYYVLTAYRGLFRSSDNCTSWTNTIIKYIDDPAFMSSSCNQMIETSKGNLLLATDIGFYESKDNGISWNRRIDELNYSKITDVNISDEGVILAVTSKGIFTSSNTVTSVSKEEMPTQYQLLQNFPNPFNPITTINYSIPNSSFVTLKVYDILGREVTTLVNENKNAGYYKVNFDASKLTSGIYIYKITNNDFVQSKKMVLMK